jgi:hypothetical protein
MRACGDVNEVKVMSALQTADDVQQATSNERLSYEPLLRELGRLIDEERWHDVVVVESDEGVFLKGLRLQQGATADTMRPARRVIPYAMLGQEARTGVERREQPKARGLRRVWPWS